MLFDTNSRAVSSAGRAIDLHSEISIFRNSLNLLQLQSFQSIIRILKDEKLKKKLATNGMEFARNNYDWENISSQFLKLYEDLT